MDPDTTPSRFADRPAAVRDDRDLLAYWRAMMGELGFGERSLWLLFIHDDGEVEPHVTHIAELPDHPEDGRLDGLMYVCDEVRSGLDGEVAVAILVSRPGGAATSDADRAWGSRIIAAARRRGVPLHPVHLATDVRLRVLAPDDLIGAD